MLRPACSDYDMMTSLKPSVKLSNAASPKKSGGGSGGGKREEGWMEVKRRYKKITVPASAVARVIGRQGASVNAIKEISGANIETDKLKNGDRCLTIKYDHVCCFIR